MVQWLVMVMLWASTVAPAVAHPYTAYIASLQPLTRLKTYAPRDVIADSFVPGLGWNGTGQAVSNDLPFIMVSNQSGASEERSLAVTAPLTLLDGGANGAITVGIGTITYLGGGTGLTAAPTNGQLLIGNGSGYTLATLTAGTGIGITNGAGSISIKLNDTSVVAGTYASADITIDAQGRITAAAAGAGSTAAPSNATYVTLSTNGTLTNERVLTAGGNISVTDAGAGSTVTVALDTTAAIRILRATGNDALSAGNTGDTQPRCQITSDGGIKFGAGSASAVDVLLKRAASSTLSVRNAADSAYGTTQAATFNAFAGAADANPTVQVTTTGIKFGAGGASSPDFLLKRDGGGSPTFLLLRDGGDTADRSLAVAAIQASTTGSFTGDLTTSADLHVEGAKIKVASLTYNIPDISSATNYFLVEPSTVTPGAGKVFYSNGTRGAVLETGTGTSTQVLHGGATPSFGGVVTGDITDGTIANADHADGSLQTGKTDTFTSTDQTITAAGTLTLAHSLGRLPKFICLWLVAQNSVLGYTAGDVLACPVGQDSTSTTDSRGISIVPDTTNLNVKFGSTSGTFTINRKDTGAAAGITNTDWKIRFCAWCPPLFILFFGVRRKDNVVPFRRRRKIAA